MGGPHFQLLLRTAAKSARPLSLLITLGKAFYRGPIRWLVRSRRESTLCEGELLCRRRQFQAEVRHCSVPDK
jgi:hypothetical protein